MYDELVKTLRLRAALWEKMYDEDNVLKQAADAIEELSRENGSLAKTVQEASEALRKRRPVVRGKWIQTTQPLGWRDEECAECSACGEDFVLDEWAMDDFTNLMHFCPNCGADMREEN